MSVLARTDLNASDTHDIVRPFDITTRGSTKFVPKCELLNIPCRRLDLDHVDMDDPLFGIPCSFPRFVKCSTAITFEPTLASVKASSERI